MDGEMTVQSLDRVLAFLPFFEDQDSKFYEVRTDLSGFAPYIYTNKVDKFLNILDSEGFTSFIDWADWQDEALGI